MSRPVISADAPRVVVGQPPPNAPFDNVRADPHTAVCPGRGPSGGDRAATDRVRQRCRRHLARCRPAGSAAPAVASIGLGESDLRSDLALRGGEAGLAYARGRIVTVARAAGLPPPAMSVWPDVRDLDGLAESCRVGLGLGLSGRCAIHPVQLPVIVEAFRPTAVEVSRGELLDGLAAGEAAQRGGVLLADGRFADSAMVRGARAILALAAKYPPR